MMPHEQDNTSRRDWLKTIALGGAAAMTGHVAQAETAPAPTARRIPIAVSTYSYWHFQEQKYPIDKVIEDAARLGFDGVEILHRQMDNETVPYMNKLKRLAFDNGLALPLLSIHQSFVQPKPEDRKKDIEHTLKCINLATQMGIPAIRMNTGSWRTVKRDANYYKDGKEPPVQGFTDQDAIKWCIESMQECLVAAEKAGVVLAIENHWGLSSNIDYLLEIYKPLASSPAMGMNVDTGNFVGDPYPQFERLAPYATIVQAKTYYGGGHYYDLDLDYKRIAGILRKANFKGYVSLEMEGKEDPATAVPKSLKVLREALS
ncbi:sugar phosphate isomerase/epimerase [Dyadobacter sp. BE34]|uniref:Sugar phosphate isomerase/epimerase n=1 Tax=Dyadobacter fermentans TaxID=94254 RepID=A0ABU1R1E5_9BACT|nr:MULTISPECIES: sugar phosphate isomerase/epimerase family protein [Dyadobacter]MDR6807231.1 sugar phosphate isomerase/epimerase [Dyadobacter fermentans]MDR7044972.1 sugar phosphate isomerase/epimerase [Dyadobacter sp. BE242]MDR7199292.1 sugar phosphate isomerase/epimerase [Dyadobacter sp. BE34]MDR7217252.1 sugar phosphate isomerase/epimerase [Dyadobacter sp. BE31]MDR7265185.1 sugar phosphate isomerase/epimerase [Dyadobacter sp. BE32]